MVISYNVIISSPNIYEPYSRGRGLEHVSLLGNSHYRPTRQYFIFSGVILLDIDRLHIMRLPGRL